MSRVGVSCKGFESLPSQPQESFHQRLSNLFSLNIRLPTKYIT